MPGGPLFGPRGGAADNRFQGTMPLAEPRAGCIRTGLGRNSLIRRFTGHDGYRSVLGRSEHGVATDRNQHAAGALRKLTSMPFATFARNLRVAHPGSCHC
jgi:hypothetical protein